MTFVAWIIAAVVALLLQPKISIFEYPLNLSVAVVYAFGIRQAMQRSAAAGSADVSAEVRSTLFGAAIGLLEDAMTGAMIGPNILSKGLCGLISSFVFRDIFFAWESSLGGVVLCLMTMADGLVVAGCRLLFSNAVMGGGAVAELVTMQAIMNIPFGLLIRPGRKEAATEQGWFRRRKYN